MIAVSPYGAFHWKEEATEEDKSPEKPVLIFGICEMDFQKCREHLALNSHWKESKWNESWLKIVNRESCEFFSSHWKISVKMEVRSYHNLRLF